MKMSPASIDWIAATIALRLSDFGMNPAAPFAIDALTSPPSTAPDTMTTVKAHVSAILAKLNVYSRTQAVILANKINFVPAPMVARH